MAIPILTLELSADEESIFVYAGGYEPRGDGRVSDESRALLACVGRQREDLEEVIARYVTDALQSCG